MFIEQEPSCGYCTVASMLGLNKNTAQRIFQVIGWQVRSRPLAQRPRIEVLPWAPDLRWATALCPILVGPGWLAELGAGDRLLHPTNTGLAPVAQWQIQRRQSQALGMKTPAKAYALAA